MKIAIGSDHAAFELKEQIKKTLDLLQIPYEDAGAYNTESVDYPDYARKVASAVRAGGTLGILCCGTGIGMSIAANKMNGIRAALCHDTYTARMSREHNDANVLVLGGRVMKNAAEVSSIVRVWLETEFEGGRHQRRVDKIKQLEEEA